MNMWDFASGHPYAWALVSVVMMASPAAVVIAAVKAWAAKCDHPTCEHPIHFVDGEAVLAPRKEQESK